MISILVSAGTARALSPDKVSPMPNLQMDFTDSEFCQKSRYERESAINKEPDLAKIDAINSRDSALCFTPDENLYFVANQEAQTILGPHAPWYLKIAAEFKNRVEEACRIMGYENDEVSRAYDHCIENRFEELMGPYEDKYQREAGNYVVKRKQIAESLVVRCDAALSIKRSRLPKDLRFPLAYFDKRINSLPSWFVEEKLDDPEWIEKVSRLKADELMNEILGADCPGNMVFWVTYTPPTL
ncbi:hypothetical protein ACH42_05990 [Endozoicomonas sp. (ex Bugula neritina AB1)]|nr:hypothetical protein ACH42_05990 [Endozoicomonas sp. (ex Bugula neritina AB1)]